MIPEVFVNWSLFLRDGISRLSWKLPNVARGDSRGIVMPMDPGRTPFSFLCFDIIIHARSLTMRQRQSLSQ